MQRHPARIMKLMLLLLTSLYVLLDYQSAYALRTCTVQKVLHGGGYSFVNCTEGSKELWLATTETKVRRGEKIRFGDEPATNNFYYQPLKQNFETIIFTQIQKDPNFSRIDENQQDRLCDVCEVDCANDYAFEDVYAVLDKNVEKQLTIFKSEESFVVTLVEDDSCVSLFEEDGSKIKVAKPADEKSFPEISVCKNGDDDCSDFKWSGKKYSLKRK